MQEPITTTVGHLTTEMKLPAWVIVLLFKQRWDIEKVFDEVIGVFHTVVQLYRCIQTGALCEPPSPRRCHLCEEIR